jgi:hypothetical protein
MPKAIPEWPVKNYIGLYQTLEKRCKGLRVAATELKAFEANLPIYLEGYFSEAFGDTGTLQGMKDLEGKPLAIMAQIKHAGTGLSLEWKPEDTAAARESATILKQRLRDREEDPDNIEEITNAEYLVWFTYETRYRLCLEQRPAAARRGTNDKYIKSIIIALLKLRSNSSNITQVLKSILTCAVHICRRSKIFNSR